MALPCTFAIIFTNGPELIARYVPSMAKVSAVISAICLIHIVSIDYIFTMSNNARYTPSSLSRRDLKKQRKGLAASRRAYKRGVYIPRPRVASFRNKPSGHVVAARRIYGIDSIVPSRRLAKATGCSVAALKQIVKKGEGAYYSSGSRPNQTAQSWAYARLASAITGGNAAKVDMHILEKGCSKSGRAYKMAHQ